MARPDKEAAVAEIATLLRQANAAVLTEYRGLSVAQLTRLRRSLGTQTTYAVVKNTLTAIAARQAGIDAFDGQLSGPTAIAFVAGDPVEAAKGLRDFSRTNPQLVVKGGMLDGRALTAAQIRELADLEPREVLLAKLAGAMKASLTGAVYLFAAPLSQAVRTLDALRAKLEADAPVAVAPPADAPDGPDADGAASPAAADAPATVGQP